MGIAILNPAIRSISGRAGDIVFYSYNGTTYFRSYVTPRNPDTAAQRSNRCLFRDAMKAWQGLSSYDKAAFSRRAKRLGMAGHNLFISRYISRRKRNRAENSNNAAPQDAAGRDMPGFPRPSPSLHILGLSVTGSIPCHMTPNASRMPGSRSHGP